MHIDAHQHFWHYDPQQYGWIGPQMERLKRDYLPHDLAPLLDSAGVGGTVAVQARQTLAETRWLMQLASEYAFIRGVVGWVDLRSPHLDRELAEHAAHPRLCGVRHVVHDEADDRFLLRDDVVRGIERLHAYGLTFDLLIFPKHLPVACELVARVPEQRFVLDHIAKPRIRDGVLDPWADDLRALAAFPNVYCKVSGMVTEADWERWTPDHLAPYLDVVFEAFGPRRILVGSDWPVCTLAAPYGETMDVVGRYVARLSGAEQAAVLGETAATCYGLE